ncbi:MAG: sucrose synthase [Desulfonatronovibrio sp.]
MMKIDTDQIEVNSPELRKAVYLFLRNISRKDKVFLLRSELEDMLKEFFEDEENAEFEAEIIFDIFKNSQVACVSSPWVYLSVRPHIGTWQYFRFHMEDVLFDEIEVNDYLRFEEMQVNRTTATDDFLLEIDLEPFNREFPKLSDSRYIGKGVEFLNRHLSGRFFQPNKKGHDKLYKFLRVHQCQGRQLMLNDRIESLGALRMSLRKAVKLLKRKNKDQEWDDIAREMRDLGFEPGWGRKIVDILENLELLLEILEAPSPRILADFLSRIPMLFKLVIVSPHGYFGQSNVLGMPDTGGQIVYILDQVRALEKEMYVQIRNQGLDIEPEIVVLSRLIPESGETTCNQRLEPIVGTRNARILRVPFRYPNGEIVQHWISRFHVWPFLERYSLDSTNEVQAELKGRPDLIIGNYSDGNLVASLMARTLKVTQCNIAHALEKSKYLFSSHYWKDNESQYRFSSQFTADLISMNTADFIITSTYQEIAGTEESVGQYETYQSFTMPDLYRVIKGIDVFDPKFNVVSPGADENVYFPFYDKDRRLNELHEELDTFIFGPEDHQTRGILTDPEKPLIFTMARLDKIKNLTGLVRWYAENDRLRSLANLVVVAGYINRDHSSDEEERACIDEMHELFEEYGLHEQVRWIGARLDKNMTGELYRYVADSRGVFVQPALFEAFGLTVVEAMSSGVPVFATIFGGPLEIIEHGISGFHIDPTHGDKAAESLADFFSRCAEDPSHWEKISAQGINRVDEKYNWRLYAHKLLSFSRIYGFWKFVTNLERDETRRYLEMFYSLKMRSLSE